MSLLGRDRGQLDLHRDYNHQDYTRDPYGQSRRQFQAYGSKPTDRQWRDPFKSSNNLEQSKFDSTSSSFEKKEFKPKSDGVHGEMSIQSRPVDVRDVKPKIQEGNVRHLRTFESYGLPSGPDVKTRPMGPDYVTNGYQYSGPYKPTIFTPIPHRDPLIIKRSYVDSKHKEYDGNVHYNLTEDNNLGMRHWNTDFVDDTVYSKCVEREKIVHPKETYIAPKKEKLKPKKESPKSEKKAKSRTPSPKPVAAIIPVRTHSPSPTAKTFVTTGTNTNKPAMKTTQTETRKHISMATQSQNPNAKDVVVQTAAVGVSTAGTQSVPKITSTSTQYTASKTKETRTQTSPMPTVPPLMLPPSITPTQTYTEQQRRSPTPTQNPKQESPRSTSSRRRSPDEAPIVVAAVVGTAAGSHARPKSTTPKQKSATSKRRSPIPASKTQHNAATPPNDQQFQTFTPSPGPMITPAPVVASKQQQQDYSPKQQHTPYPYTSTDPSPRKPSPKLPRQGPAIALTPSPYQSKFESPKPYFPTSASRPEPEAGLSPEELLRRRTLPPEVVACLEAYDSVHPPLTGRSIPSVQRTLHLT